MSHRDKSCSVRSDNTQRFFSAVDSLKFPSSVSCLHLCVAMVSAVALQVLLHLAEEWYQNERHTLLPALAVSCKAFSSYSGLVASNFWRTVGGLPGLTQAWTKEYVQFTFLVLCGRATGGLKPRGLPEPVDLAHLTSLGWLLFACLPVVCMFAERAGIAREFPFAFVLALAPWVCHQDLHGCFNARRPEHKVRPRFFMTLIAESNCGKSPFFRQCLDAIFVSHSRNRPCLTDTFPDRFVVPGPGKDKTLFVQTCTGSDFTKRMKATRGHLCWQSEEAWSALDIAWAKGKGKVSQNSNKVQHCFLLNTQNGCSYSPVSIQAEQFFVPTTNFCFFHAGQPKVIHDYWGQAFLKDCPFGGMGWEFRPTFLWPRSQPDEDESSPHVTFEGANRFMLDLLATLALKYGQTLDSKNFPLTLLIPSDAAVPLWNKFRHEAESSKDVVPPFAAGAVGKYCFTTTAHIMACHLLEQSFLETKDGISEGRVLCHSATELIDLAP